MKFTTTTFLLLPALAHAINGTPVEDYKAPEYTPPPNMIEFNKDYSKTDRHLREGGRELQSNTCFERWNLWTPDGCNFDALLELMNEEQADWGCGHDSLTELKRIFGTNSEDEVRDRVQAMCVEAMEAKEASDFRTFSAITKESDVFDKAYFDGGTYYNEGREGDDDAGIKVDQFWAGPKDRIVSAYYSAARYNTGIQFPSDISNFENCEIRAAMCCWTQDRQADDDNGNCATPYEENCVDADPADNTDICYVDMSRAPESSRTERGFAIFADEAEGDAHCHGFAWDTDETDVSAFHKGANLFYVSMYDHLSQRGYVRNVPGSPMCGCVEQMPVVSRSDCTELELLKQWTGYIFQRGVGLTARMTHNEVEFNSCQGANNNNNDLEAYYQRLVNEGRATRNEMNVLKQTIVGEGQCERATTRFLSSQGLVRG